MSDAGVLRCHIIVRGKVQGVFFRKHTKISATNIGGIVGLVRNLRDGTVEVIAESSDKGRLQQLELWCSQTGSPKSRVDGVTSAYEPRSNFEFSTFFIDK
eukprot:TRINITY_DN64726_c0_g1_i1.p2 TRINITY_DN64726_c0_g1~~TRINITY_DN64726_c0_g1_i1.p2  ORF type:complete len:100 (+),score=26.90 TRINITY_DN64726_c0_g1_i1:42-341(+)